MNKKELNEILAISPQFRLGFDIAKETIETKFSHGELTLYYLNEWYIKCNNDIERYTMHKDINSIEYVNGSQTAIEYGVSLFNSRPEYATRNLTIFDIWKLRIIGWENNKKEKSINNNQNTSTNTIHIEQQLTTSRKD